MILVRSFRASKLPPRLVGEDDDRPGLADEKVLFQQPHALHALALGVELGEHVVGDRHVEAVPGGNGQHEKLPDQDQARMGDDLAKPARAAHELAARAQSASDGSAIADRERLAGSGIAVRHGASGVHSSLAGRGLRSFVALVSRLTDALRT